MKKPPPPKKKPSSSKKPDASVGKARSETGTRTPASLRQEAEKRLRLQTQRIEDLSATDLKTLVHELGTHQIELEMQNEELRRGQEELIVSRQRYADLYDFAPVGYVTIDEQGLIREANLMAGQMLGRSKRGLLNKPLKNFIKAVNWKAFQEHWTATVESWRLQTREITLWRANGGPLHVQLQSIAVEDADGSVIVRTSIIDITERARMEEALRASEAKYRSLFDNMINGFAVHEIMVDAAGRPVDYRFLETNKAFETLTGLKAADIVGKRVTQALPGIANDPGDWIGTYGRIALTGGEARFERFAATLNRWYSVTAYSPAKGFFATIFEDITERKKADLALRQSEEQFRRAIEDAPIPVIMHAEDGEVLQISRTWTELTGYSIEDIRTFDEWTTHAVYGSGAHQVRDHLRSIFTGSSRKARLDFAIRTKSGEARHWSFSASVPGQLSDGRRFVVGMALDITDQKKMEEILREKDLAIATSANGIAFCDLSGRITYVNDAFLSLWGYGSVDEVLGRSAMAFAEDPEDAQSIVAEIGRRGSWRGERRALRKDHRTFPVEISASIVMDEQGNTISLMAQFTDITERRRVEEELRQIQQDLTRAQEVGNIGSWRLDVRKNVLTWSDETYSIFGIAPGAPQTYESFLGSVHPDDREYVDRKWREGLRGGDYDLEHRIVADGRIKWIREKAYLEFDDSGALLGGFGIAQDITKRKAAEIALAELNATLEQLVAQRTRFYAVLARINEAIVRNRDRQTLFDEVCRIIIETGGFRLAWVGLLDPATRSVTPVASSGATAYLEGLKVVADDVPEGRGPTGRAIVEQRPVINLDFETAEHMAAWRERARKSGIRSSSAFPLRVGGRVIGALTIYSEQPHFFTQDELSLLDTLTDDLSFALEMIDVDRQKHTAELEGLRLAAALESAADAVVITEPDQGRIVYVNDAFVKMTGYPKEEVIGETLHMLDSGKHDPSFFEGIRSTLLRDGVWNGRLINRKKDGILYFEDSTFSTVLDRSGKILNYVSIKRDVTEKLRLESIAESVSLMDSIGAVFAGVRHEIGNPVNNTKIMLSILQEQLATLSADRVRHYIERSLTELGRVENLLKTLKSFNLFEAPALDDLDIARLFNQFRNMVDEDLARQGITIATHVFPGAESVYADSRALQHVLLNLLTNAAYALAGQPTPRIDVSAARTDDRIRIRFCDNGRGMSAAETANLFKPFHTTKSQGTGLGLVIVKKMLNAMNGSIDIESRQGSGTVVTLYLPGGNRGEGTQEEDTSHNRR